MAPYLEYRIVLPQTFLNSSTSDVKKHGLTLKFIETVWNENGKPFPESRSAASNLLFVVQELSEIVFLYSPFSGAKVCGSIPDGVISLKISKSR
jgi:hypothetical protein